MKYYKFNSAGKYVGYRETSAVMIPTVETTVEPVFIADNTPYWKNGEWVQVLDLLTVVEMTVPTNSPINTDIVCNLTVKEKVSGDTVTTLSDTYYVPLKNVMTGDLDQMLTIVVASGVGSVTFQIGAIGVYSIEQDLISPKPVAELLDVPNIAVV